jgi:hypothetical protein
MTLENSVSVFVWTPAHAPVWNSFLDYVRACIWDSASTSVQISVWDFVSDPVRDSVHYSVYSCINKKMNKQL